MSTSTHTISTINIVDTYECTTRVQLETTTVEPEKNVDPLVIKYGDEHEEKVVTKLSKTINFNKNTKLTHTTPQNYTQATIDTQEYSLRPDFLLTPQTLNTLTGTQLTSTNLLIPADAKAARSTKPAAILQIALYGLALETLGYDLPPVGLLFLGDSHSFKTETIKLKPYYLLVKKLIKEYRTITAQTITNVDKLYGSKKSVCDTCVYTTHCTKLRATYDDLTRIANITKETRTRLEAGGVTTVAGLVAATAPPVGLNNNTFFNVQNQARLQTLTTKSTIPWEWVSTKSGRPNGPELMQLPTYTDTPVTVADHNIGFVKSLDSAQRLPESDPGDIFFDFEGFPFHSSGALEYLFGWVTIQDSEPVFDYLWADTELEEKTAFETFIKFLLTHFEKYPQAHVYHYAPYETTALRRLAEKYDVYKDETRELIAAAKFIDLFNVVKKSLQAGVESYSIKKLEPMVGFRPRTADVKTAMDSVGEYDTYTRTDNSVEKNKLKNALLAYNEDDCVSTYVLASWLWEGRGAAIKLVPEDVINQEPYVPAQKTIDKRKEILSLKEQLKMSSSTTAHLLVDCVEYYLDEEKIVYFNQFNELNNPTPDTCVLTGLNVLALGPRVNSRAAITLTHTGPVSVSGSFTMISKAGMVGVARISPDELFTGFGVKYEPSDNEILVLGNVAKVEAAVAAGAICVDSVVQAGAKQEALNEICKDVLAGNSIGVVGALLNRATSATLPQTGNVGADIISATDSLTSGEYFAVQGPPGAGKTFTAANIIETAVGKGWSVGVCSVSHKAVENVLKAVVGKNIAVSKHASGKARTDVPWTELPIGTWLSERPTDVCGGTVFSFAGLGKAAAGVAVLDLLVIDEASQMSVVDAFAAARCAKRVILLGDPCQLPHVSQAAHEGVADYSILGYLVADQSLIPQDQGYFLDKTYRFGSLVAAPVSELAYEGKLSSAVDQQFVGQLGGVYRKVVPSVGCVRINVAEVDACVDIIEQLVGMSYDGGAVGLGDIMVVSPYNDMVRLLRSRFKDAGFSSLSVGTVDSFQGQECLVVLFCLTASSDVGGRGAGFVLDVARLNVSLSRARVAAVVVGSSDVAAGVALNLEGLKVACTAAFIDDLPELPDFS